MSSKAISFDMMSGRGGDYLSEFAGGIKLHSAVVPPFLELQKAAAKEGLDLQIASGYRDYARQLAIWNAKAQGQRPLLDGQGNILDTSAMTETEIVWSILRWSALPGCSRHHWGTDMDVWDRAAVDADYSLQLTPEEYVTGGPFAALSEWLQQYASSFGFDRPYAEDRGGVAPEPWHLSYQPIAEQFEAKLDRAFVRKVLDNSQLALRGTVLAHLDDIIDRFILPPTREKHG
ncbi:MAG: D-alanyl-D-alanine carboxypeptidase family protein [Gammaproteobacteria bacterium]|nr:MAG: D-alanyl-D-alanine carboxypeptidase family protein [Gammaproteobacteria bacterium]